MSENISRAVQDRKDLRWSFLAVNDQRTITVQKRTLRWVKSDLSARARPLRFPDLFLLFHKLSRQRRASMTLIGFSTRQFELQHNCWRAVKRSLLSHHYLAECKLSGSIPMLKPTALANLSQAQSWYRLISFTITCCLATLLGCSPAQLSDCIWKHRCQSWFHHWARLRYHRVDAQPASFSD
jgi:hypothetical protein